MEEDNEMLLAISMFTPFFLILGMHTLINGSWGVKIITFEIVIFIIFMLVYHFKDQHWWEDVNGSK